MGRVFCIEMRHKLSDFIVRNKLAIAWHWQHKYHHFFYCFFYCSRRITPDALCPAKTPKMSFSENYLAMIGE